MSLWMGLAKVVPINKGEHGHTILDNFSWNTSGKVRLRPFIERPSFDYRHFPQNYKHSKLQKNFYKNKSQFFSALTLMLIFTCKPIFEENVCSRKKASGQLLTTDIFSKTSNLQNFKIFLRYLPWFTWKYKPEGNSSNSIIHLKSWMFESLIVLSSNNLIAFGIKTKIWIWFLGLQLILLILSLSN